VKGRRAPQRQAPPDLLRWGEHPGDAGQGRVLAQLPGEAYEGEFHNGPRTLVRYGVEDFDELLDIGVDPFVYVLAAFA